VAGETAIVFYNTVTGDVAKVTSTVNVSSFSAGTTGLTPSTATTGAVTLAGTLITSNGGTGVTTSTGSGNNVLSTSPTLVTPILGTPTSVTLTNATGLPLTTGVTGTLATTNGGTGLTSFTANGVVYASSTSALATGSALEFDGTNFGVGTAGNTKNQQSVVYKVGVNAVYQQIANGSTGLASTNGVRLGVSSGGTGELYSPTALISYIDNSEQMRLTSTGLGIGTSSPAYKLDVQTSTGNAVVNVYQTASSGSSIASSVLRTAGTGPSWWQVDTGNTASGLNGAIRWFDNFAAAERMRIDSSGNVGIGTSSPASALQVGDANTSGKGITLRNGGGASRTAYITTIGTTAASADQTWYSGVNVFASNGSYEIKNAAGSGLILDTSANLGLGVTPSAWSGGAGFDLPTYAGIAGNSSAGFVASFNAYYNSGWKYKATTAARAYVMDSANHYWLTAPSGTAGNAISFTQAMTLDASGNLLLGTTTAIGGARLDLKSSNTILATFTSGDANGTAYEVRGSSGKLSHYATYQNSGVNCYHSWWVTDSSGTQTQPMTLDTSGNLLVGTTSASAGAVFKVTGTVANSISHQVWSTASSTNAAYWTEGTNYVNGVATGANSGATMIKVNKDSGSLRSINAAGSINASGADYAEYMTKTGNFVVAKGDVIGINADGKLTNVFADAVSFAVKSTDPSYVGNDSWGVDMEGNALESARQKVDRIAFAGQVPVNVTGAMAGQYIIPINDNGAIKGQAVSNPTFEQYQIAVGKVIAIESDGRAKIIVKVA
jgi:hypothetical protein